MVNGWSRLCTTADAAPAAVSRTDLAGQRNGELVAADTGEHRFRRKHRPQAGRQGLHQLVAAVVADRVVHGLEAVDVEIDDRELARLARRLTVGRVEQLVEAGPVLEPGHPVGTGGDKGFLLALGERDGDLACAKGGDEGDDAEERKGDRDRGKNAPQHRVAGRGRRPDVVADGLAEDVERRQAHSSADARFGAAPTSK